VSSSHDLAPSVHANLPVRPHFSPRSGGAAGRAELFRSL
jgi:hypothetical protein